MAGSFGASGGEPFQCKGSSPEACKACKAYMPSRVGAGEVQRDNACISHPVCDKAACAKLGGRLVAITPGHCWQCFHLLDNAVIYSISRTMLASILYPDQCWHLLFPGQFRHFIRFLFHFPFLEQFWHIFRLQDNVGTCSIFRTMLASNLFPGNCWHLFPAFDNALTKSRYYPG